MTPGASWMQMTGWRNWLGLTVAVAALYVASGAFLFGLVKLLEMLGR